MSLFNRMFKVGQSNANALINRFEDPIRMTEQGIRDLKKDLQDTLQSLAQVRSIAISTRKEAVRNRNLAEDYEKKAMVLLRKAQEGAMETSEAEHLASRALEKKNQLGEASQRLTSEACRHESMADSLSTKVNKIKSTVATYENELVTLKARAKTAAATKKINAQLSRIDSSGTISMLEAMKTRVEEEESLAAAYGELALENQGIDDEIEKALLDDKSRKTSLSLIELKTKMGIQ